MRADCDDRVIYGLLAAMGAVRVVVALALDQRFGAEATIAAVLMVIGVIGWRAR